jgi:hypothetical protein
MFCASVTPRSFKKHLAGLTVAIGAIGLAAQVAAAYPTGNLLTNPGYETNSLTGIANVLGPPFSTNIWGDEDSTITGTVGAVSPRTGSQMLSMTTDGNVATQTLQVVDVSAYSADISAGLVTVNLSAYFNVDSNVVGAVGGIFITFWDNTMNYTGPTNIGSEPTFDSNPSTWEQASLTNIPVPVNTTFLLAQVLYVNATMIDSLGVDQPGYVDDASLTLDAVPEPASLGLLAFGAIGFLRVRRLK